MPYWKDLPADASNIRLHVPRTGWRSSGDEVAGEDGRPGRAGGTREVASALLNVLNATNVVVLTGAGSSFAAENPAGRPTPAGMADVWDTVRQAEGERDFDAIIAQFGPARIDVNIEKLLTLRKLHLELNESAPPQIAEPQRARNCGSTDGRVVVLDALACSRVSRRSVSRAISARRA